MGYREVETSGFADLSAKAFRQALDRAGLRCPSCHLKFDGDDWGPQFEDAHTMGAQYAVSSILIDFKGTRSAEQAFARIDAVDLDGLKQIIEKANRIAEAAARAGLKYAYHNHNFEFKRLYDSRYGYDLLLEQTDKHLVSFELDCGWMRLAGVDPVEYLKAHGRRIRMLHLKDFMKEDAASTRLGEHKGAELGHGFIDFAPIVAAGKGAGVEHYFYEQEPPFFGTTPLEAAKVSAKYLERLNL